MNILILLLGIYSIYSSTIVLGKGYLPVLYALIFIYSFLYSIVILFKHKKAKARLFKKSGFIFSLALFYFLPIYSHEVLYSNWILGDALCYLLPSLLILLSSLRPTLFSDFSFVTKLCLLLSIGSLVAPIFSVNNRFEPPSILLPIFVSILFYSTSTFKALVFFPCLVSLAILSFISGQRTSFLLCIISFAVITFIYVYNANIRKIFMTVFLISLLCLSLVSFDVFLSDSYLVSPTANQFLSETYEGSRFNKLRHEDASLETRINEAKDVLRSSSSWSFFQYIYGKGHGAVFKPYNSFIPSNTTENHDTHHIHIGIVLMFYRYGIIGVLILLFLCYLVIRRLSLIKGIIYDLPSGESVNQSMNAPIFFSVSLLIYLINFMFRNILVDPLFSFVLSGFFFYGSSLTKKMKT